MNSAFDFNVAGIEFIAGMLAVAAVFFHLRAVPIRQAVWAAANFFVLWLVLPNAAYWAALAVFIGSGYVAAQVLRSWPSRWLLSVYLIVLVVAFVVLKQYAFLDYLPQPLWQASRGILGVPMRDGAAQRVVQIVGLSFILFRQIHVLVDAAQGQFERLSLWSYINYQISLFTILAGPIQRFQDFDEQWQSLAPALADTHELLVNCMRLLAGVVKIGLIAPLFYRGWDELLPAVVNVRVHGWKYIVEFFAVFYFYPVYLYCNFAGYCDIVIAANRFFGVRLPENFNRPWLARNVIEFWTRWHITLGTWIRDYLFMPMYKPVVERWPARAQWFAPLFYFLAFMVAGAWHGTTFNFLLYGVWQGLGMSVVKLYELLIVARHGRKGLREHMQSRPVRVAAIAANFHFQCMSMMIFSLSPPNDASGAWTMWRGLAAAITGHHY